MIIMETELMGLTFFGGLIMGTLLGILGNLVVTSYFRRWDDKNSQLSKEQKIIFNKNIFRLSIVIFVIDLLFLIGVFVYFT